MARLKLSDTLQEQMLDTLKYPIHLVYENGAIAFLNQAAEQWLNSNTVLRVKSQQLMGRDAQKHALPEKLLQVSTKDT